MGPQRREKLPVQPAQLPHCGLQRRRVRDPPPVRQHRQVADADVHADPRLGPVGATDGPLDLAGEADKPAATLPADRRRQDPRGPLLQPASELAGGLVGAQPAKTGQGDVVAVGLHPDRAGGEAAGVAGAALALAAGEAHARALAAVAFGVGPVGERPCQPVQAR